MSGGPRPHLTSEHDEQHGADPHQAHGQCRVWSHLTRWLPAHFAMAMAGSWLEAASHTRHAQDACTSAVPRGGLSGSGCSQRTCAQQAGPVSTRAARCTSCPQPPDTNDQGPTGSTVEQIHQACVLPSLWQQLWVHASAQIQARSHHGTIWMIAVKGPSPLTRQRVQGGRRFPTTRPAAAPTLAA